MYLGTAAQEDRSLARGPCSAGVLAVATGMFSRDEIAVGEPDQLLGDLGDTGRVVSILVE